MRLKTRSASWLALLLSLTTSALAVNLLDALAELPECGAQCFSDTIGKSSCGFDPECICSDKDFHETAQACILEKCSIPEGLEVARIEGEACERPERSQRNSLLLPLIIEVPAWLCPWLRTYSRWATNGEFAVDDWMMLVCGICYTIFLVLGQWTANLAFGVDTWSLSTDTVTYGLKLFFVDESFYLLCLGLTKVCILCFYLRVFPTKPFKYAAYTAMLFVVIPTIVFIFVQIFQCNPVEFAWEGWLDKDREEKCMDINILAYTAAAFSIAQDLAILVLPLPWLLGLNMGSKSKAGIILMFSLGIFVLITSCVRLKYIVTFAHTTNPSWDFSEPLLWSGLEVAVSIVVACLPAIRVLVARFVPGLITSITRGSKRNTRGGYLQERSSCSTLRGHHRSKNSEARSTVFFASKGSPNESQIELGLHLGDKSQGNVQTQISAPQDKFETGDAGIKVQTTTVTRVDLE